MPAGAATRWPWMVLAIVWTVAMLAVGAWLAHAGIFGWRDRKTAAELSSLRAQTRLSPEMRGRLRPRMARHGATMTELTRAVTMLDHRRAAELTEALLADSELARPTASEAASLPPAFGEFEDALQTHARALLAAARDRDDDALVTAQAHMAFTCARCHAAFQGP